VLLEDGKTIIAVYPKGHGRGAIQMKRSTHGGLSQQIDRAESYYQRSAPLESHIAPDSRPTLVAMTQIYHRLLRKLASEPERVLRERVSLSLFTKLMIGWRASWAK
jgi:phytoene/squalene synthetase